MQISIPSKSGGFPTENIISTSVLGASGLTAGDIDDDLINNVANCDVDDCIEGEEEDDKEEPKQWEKKELC